MMVIGKAVNISEYSRGVLTFNSIILSNVDKGKIL